MLSSEDVFKNIVLPSRVISTGVNSPDGVHWAHGHSCHIHEINGTSKVEVDAASKMQKPLPGKGVSSRSTGRGLNDISRLQSDSAAEINRHQHWVCHKTSSTQDHNVFADIYFMFHAMTGVAVAFCWWLANTWIGAAAQTSTKAKEMASQNSVWHLSGWHGWPSLTTLTPGVPKWHSPCSHWNLLDHSTGINPIEISGVVASYHFSHSSCWLRLP